MDSLNVPRLQHVQEGRQRKIPHAFFHTGTRRNEIMLPVYEMSATDEKLRKLGTPATGWHWDGHRWRKKGVNDHED